MTNSNEVLTNPLGLLGLENGDSLKAGDFGAVLARAGVGKTALVVQMALNKMADGFDLLHISLAEPIAKVDVYYREVFSLQVGQHQGTNAENLWDDIIRRRFIMTFQVEGFSLPKLEERLTDLTTQNIFHPKIVVIDGLPFDSRSRPQMEELKALAERIETPIWYTITTHRHESPAQDGLPIQLSRVQDLFKIAIELQPIDNVVEIRVLKGGRGNSGQPELILDPATMLIKKRN